MRFNSARPIKALTPKEQEGLRKLLLPDAFPPNTPGTDPPNQILSVEEFLKMDPDLKTRWGLQWNNFTQHQSRSPNDQEATALIFTFGDTVGKFLIDIIEIGQESGETGGKIRIVLPDNYNPDNLESLGVFICKATRVWQKKVGLYNQDKGWDECEADYSYTQLYSPQKELTGTQHAAAVKDWFYLTYGNIHHLIGSGPQRLISGKFWLRLLRILGVKKPVNPMGIDHVQSIINNHYGCVIKQIRDTSKFQWLGQNFPNPA